MDGEEHAARLECRLERTQRGDELVAAPVDEYVGRDDQVELAGWHLLRESPSFDDHAAAPHQPRLGGSYRDLGDVHGQHVVAVRCQQLREGAKRAADLQRSCEASTLEGREGPFIPCTLARI